MTTTAMEKHFSVQQIAENWGFNDWTVRRIFEREPGVISISSVGGGKNRHRTLRIPESVMLRVYRSLEHSSRG